MNKQEMPRWDSRDRRDQKKMRSWLNQELDNILEDELRKLQVLDWKKEKDHFAWLETHGPEIEAAQHGNIEPLRKKLPDLAAFLQLPRRTRGRRFSKLKDRSDTVQAAADDVRLIRMLWRKHYGKRNSPKYGYSAERLAADRWEVDVEDVIRRLKNPRK